METEIHFRKAKKRFSVVFYLLVLVLLSAVVIWGGAELAENVAALPLWSAFVLFMIPAFLISRPVYHFTFWKKRNARIRQGIYGLKIGSNGITNNTQEDTAFIPWSDIKDFELKIVRNGGGQTYSEDRRINIILKKPELFNTKTTGWANALRYKAIDIPYYELYIDADMLDIEPSELLGLLKKAAMKTITN